MAKITLATLEKATAQEVFDQVKDHLLTQKRQSGYTVNLGTSCFYRMPQTEGKPLMCAAGCLIGDLEYNTAFENKAWQELVSLGLVPKKHHELIRELQTIHDANDDVLVWEKQLKETATRFKLQYNE